MAILACVVLLAVCWSAFAPKGTGYYFPSWKRSAAPDVWEARQASLTNIAESLPLVLDAADRKDLSVGRKWNEWAERIPEAVQRRLPLYLPPGEEPWDWLALHADHPSVAAAVSDQWSRWDRLQRLAWRESQGNRLYTNRTEYLPLLAEDCRRGDGHDGALATALLLGYRPMPDVAARAVADRIESIGLDPEFSFVLADHDRIPPVLVKALTKELASTGTGRASVAALLLAKFDPAHFPPESCLEPLWPPGASVEEFGILAEMGLPAFSSVVATPWGARFLHARLLDMEKSGASRHRNLFGAPTLSALENVGPLASNSLPVLIRFLDDGDDANARGAARAFASLAVDSPQWSRTVSRHLTNPVLAAPLLLWMTSLGTNALPAIDAVRDVADDRVVYALPSWRADRVLLQRYGLKPIGRFATPNGKSSEWVVSPDSCPAHLLFLWPGAGPRTSASEREAPLKESEEGETVTLAILARRCLVSMTNGPAGLGVGK